MVVRFNKAREGVMAKCWPSIVGSVILSTAEGLSSDSGLSNCTHQTPRDLWVVTGLCSEQNKVQLGKHSKQDFSHCLAESNRTARITGSIQTCLHTDEDAHKLPAA